MSSKKSLIIEKYILMVDKLRTILLIDIFPEFNNVIDILFYFNYNFLMIYHPAEKIEEILELNNIMLDDEAFGIVCDLINEFLFLLKFL